MFSCHLSSPIFYKLWRILSKLHHGHTPEDIQSQGMADPTHPRPILVTFPQNLSILTLSPQLQGIKAPSPASHWEMRWDFPGPCPGSSRKLLGKDSRGKYLPDSPKMKNCPLRGNVMKCLRELGIKFPFPSAT